MDSKNTKKKVDAHDKSEKSKKMLNWVKNIRTRENPNDKKYTPYELAGELTQMVPLQANDTVLDAFRGKGAFYNQYPENVKKDWCEIDDSRDFFKWNKKVDWVGPTNPPYSKLKDVFEHSVKIAQKGIALLIGIINLSPSRIALLESHGFGITHLRIVQVRGWFSKSIFIVAMKNSKSIISFDTRYWEMPKEEREIHYAKEKERMHHHYVKNYRQKLINFRKDNREKKSKLTII
jgi:hypothetical protein